VAGSDGLTNLAMGQTHGKIIGRIIDAETGDLLPSVNITLNNSTLGSSTNFKGEYFILGVPVGSHDIMISFIGYSSVKVTNIWVSAGLSTSVDVELKQTTLQLNEEIVVTAQRTGVGRYASGTNHIIQENQIMNMFGESPTEIIAIVPGISSDNTMRGGRPSDIDYQIDGISTREGLFGGLSYESFINILSLKEIQIKTGGFNAEYGNIMSGTVNLITKEGGDEWKGDIRVKNSFSSLNGKSGDFKLNSRGERIIEFAAGGPLSKFNKNIKVFISGKFNSQLNRAPGLNVLDPAGNNITDFQHNRFAQYSFFGKAVYNLNPNMKIVAAGLSGRLNQEEDSWLWRYNTFDNALPSSIRQNYFGYIRFTHTTSRRFFYEATLEMLDSRTERGIANGNRNAFWFPGYDIVSSINNDTPLDYTVKNPYGVDNIFVGSGQLDAYWSARSRYVGAKISSVSQMKDYLLLRMGIESKFYNAKGVFKSNSFENPDTPFDTYENKPFDFSGYIGTSVDLSKIHIDSGLRFHYFNPNSNRTVKNPQNLTQKAEQELRFSPRIGVSFEIQKRLIAHANFGWQFQLPSFHSLYSLNSQNLLGPATNLSGNPSLDPQRSISYEAGLHYSLSDESSISATGFYKLLQQIEVADTTFTETGFAPQYDDIGVGKTIGLELNYIKHLGRNLGLRLSYSVSSARGSYMFFSPFPVESNLMGTLNGLNSFLSAQQLLQPTSNQIMFPLPFDRRHSFRTVIDFLFPKRSGPGFFGLKPFQNISANLSTFIESGTPFTRFTNNPSIESRFQNKRNPWFLNTNLRLKKYIQGSLVNFTLFLDIKNLLNRVEPLAKYSTSDSPLDPGTRIDARTIWNQSDNDTQAPETVYGSAADLNNDGVIDENESNTAYANFLSDFVKLRSLYQLPREIWTGLQIHF